MEFLIVDDSEAPLRHLERTISAMGHKVVGVARDGLDALDKFRTLQPDAVVMDVIMPRMNGLDALRTIRREDPQARVVMASTMRSCQCAFQSQRYGARYFLFKPFDEHDLRNVIDKLASENDGKGHDTGEAGAKRPRHAAVEPPAGARRNGPSAAEVPPARPSRSDASPESPSQQATGSEPS